MIHFDFTVNEEDATNIFDCINSKITDDEVQLRKSIIDNEKYLKWYTTDCDDRAHVAELYKDSKEKISWYEKDIEYLKDLKIRMRNKYSNKETLE